MTAVVKASEARKLRKAKFIGAFLKGRSSALLRTPLTSAKRRRRSIGASCKTLRACLNRRSGFPDTRPQVREEDGGSGGLADAGGSVMTALQQRLTTSRAFVRFVRRMHLCTAQVDKPVDNDGFCVRCAACTAPCGRCSTKQQRPAGLSVAPVRPSLERRTDWDLQVHPNWSTVPFSQTTV